jgi:hypothetical protein
VDMKSRCKNICKKIWQYQKNKFIFATQTKILNNKHATHTTTYRSGELF